MSCNTKASPAAACTYVENVLGETISQRDWHDIRALAKNVGLDSTRAKADPIEARAVITGFATAVDREAGTTAESDDLTQKFLDGSPTKGTLSILSYLQNHGVTETLSSVRLTRKAEQLGKKLYPEGTPAYVGKRADIVQHAKMFNRSVQGDDGVVRWETNNSVPPEDVLEHWKRLDLITPATYERSKRELAAQTARYIEEYKQARLAMTDEQKAEEAFELRAAFGPDHVVVDVITGEKWNTGN